MRPEHHRQVSSWRSSMRQVSGICARTTVRADVGSSATRSAGQGERAGDGHALALAAGELPGKASAEDGSPTSDSSSRTARGRSPGPDAVHRGGSAMMRVRRSRRFKRGRRIWEDNPDVRAELGAPARPASSPTASGLLSHGSPVGRCSPTRTWARRGRAASGDSPTTKTVGQFENEVRVGQARRSLSWPNSQADPNRWTTLHRSQLQQAQSRASAPIRICRQEVQ